jgi:hypothetical protein
MLKHGSDQGRNFLQRAQNGSNTLLKMSRTFDGSKRPAMAPRGVPTRDQAVIGAQR